MGKKRRTTAIDSRSTETYEPSQGEHAAIDEFFARRNEKTPAPRVRVDGLTVEADHPKPELGALLLMHALGTDDLDFFNALLAQLANVGSRGQKFDERGINHVLAMVRGVEPRDEVEAMLAAQMTAIHCATMTMARRLDHVETLPQQDSAVRALTRLSRTFTAQVETLKRYRSGGEQTVRVEHVTVNEGGQAIVGSVSHGGRGSSGKAEPTS